MSTYAPDTLNQLIARVAKAHGPSLDRVTQVGKL